MSFLKELQGLLESHPLKGWDGFVKTYKELEKVVSLGDVLEKKMKALGKGFRSFTPDQMDSYFELKDEVFKITGHLGKIEVSLYAINDILEEFEEKR